MPGAAFTVNHRRPFKYRARVCDRTSSDLHFVKGKLKRKKKKMEKKQNYSKIVIVLRSIHRVEKYTHLKREKPLKRLNTFL